MLEEKSGAKILIRGRGSSKDGVQSSHPDDDDDLYVMIEGTQDAVDIAATEVEKILYNPEEAMRLKREQLRKCVSRAHCSLKPTLRTAWRK
jgi:far upstream element-binding protein